MNKFHVSYPQASLKYPELYRAGKERMYMILGLRTQKHFATRISQVPHRNLKCRSNVFFYVVTAKREWICCRRPWRDEESFVSFLQDTAFHRPWVVELKRFVESSDAWRLQGMYKFASDGLLVAFLGSHWWCTDSFEGVCLCLKA